MSKDPKEAENNRLRQIAMNALLEAEDKGILKGMLKAKLDIAKKMLNRGMDIEIISEVTGLSEKEIIDLKNQRKQDI